MFRTLIALTFLILISSGAYADKVSVEIDGYRSGEANFNDVLARTQDPDKRQRFNTIVDNLVSAEASPSGGKSVVVVIIGHSDRQDNVQQFPTADARRASELQSSVNRAVTAKEQLFELVQRRLQAMGVAVPSSFDQARNIAVAVFPAGGADLKQTVINGESERQQNRRVGLFMETFPKN